jgi:transaldolase
MKLEDLRIKLFLDSADLKTIQKYATLPYVLGFTTNPTLMRQAGVTDYLTFAKEVVRSVPDRSVSFEVLADDADTLVRQAHKLTELGQNVYVKVPWLRLDGHPNSVAIQALARQGVKLNVTALTTLNQVRAAYSFLNAKTPAILSLFVGRMADTGVDLPKMLHHANRFILEPFELLWASTREVLNVVQAQNAGFDIITVTPAILDKLAWLGKDLDEVSLETVKQFYRDAAQAGYTL